MGTHPHSLTEATLSEYRDYLEALRPDSERQWGNLDSIGLLAHLRRTVEISLREVEVEDLSNFLTRRPLVRRLIFEALPWPKGKIQAPPGFIVPPEGDFETEKENAKKALGRFVEALKEDPNRLGLSPLLGEVPFRYWSVMHGVHVRHHLKQFGVL